MPFLLLLTPVQRWYDPIEWDAGCEAMSWFWLDNATKKYFLLCDLGVSAVGCFFLMKMLTAEAQRAPRKRGELHNN